MARSCNANRVVPGSRLKPDRLAQHKLFHYWAMPKPKVRRHEPDQAQAGPARPLPGISAGMQGKIVAK
jgi:hypothetical protein